MGDPKKEGTPLIDAAAAAAVFLLSFALYARCAAPAVTVGDAGEFMTAAATLSVPHAPSFPVYNLAARAFQEAVPWGAVAYRSNLFSAFCASAALVFLFGFARTAGWPALPAALAALGFGVSESFWLDAIVTEVFALNTLFAAALLLLLARASRPNRAPTERARLLTVAAFLTGIGIGNQQILIFFGPALLWSGFDSGTGRIAIRRVGALAAAGLLGLSVYLYLPIRAQKEPPIDWNRPDTFARATASFLRKDYGTLTLALGEAPARTAANAARQFLRFGRRVASDVTWPVALVGLGGIFLCRRRDTIGRCLPLLFLLAGPFFFWLGNLPFDAQSDGVLGRFLIFPGLVLTASAVLALRRAPRAGGALFALALLIGVARSAPGALANRRQFLVWDYGRAILDTLPPNAALYLDGGDDAFYSLAYLRHVLGFRLDTDIHDRGALVFRNPYGPDFRGLSKEAKRLRRQLVERAAGEERPVFYSTMDPHPDGDTPVRPAGFLLEAARGAAVDDGATLCLRSVYPPVTSDYRTRALAAFFPYMDGRRLVLQGEIGPALAFFREARRLGSDVPWLQTNLAADYAELGYRLVTGGRTAEAESVYRDWLRLNPGSSEAMTNLGVMCEREGRLDEARALYERAAADPKNVDGLYNLGVMDWHAGRFVEAAAVFDRVLIRNPHHPTAAFFRDKARGRAIVQPPAP